MFIIYPNNKATFLVILGKILMWGIFGLRVSSAQKGGRVYCHKQPDLYNKIALLTAKQLHINTLYYNI